MARFLCAWELGGGIGHLTKLRTLAQSLMRRGHEVFLVVKDPTAAARVFHDALPSGVFPAPSCTPLRRIEPRPTECFPEILLQDGYGDVERVAASIRAWRGFLKFLKPNAVICEHAPCAALSALSSGVPYALLGTGFTCPRIVDGRWPEFGSVLVTDHRACDETLTRAWNTALARNGLPAIESSSRIVTGATAEILACLPELDPFGPRPESLYWGNWNIADEGDAVAWPNGSGPRLFGYLKPTPAVNSIMRLLQEFDCSAILYLGESPVVPVKPLPRNVRVHDRPVSMQRMSNEAEAMLLNGTVGTTTTALQAGLPTWHAPIYLEQILVGRRIERLDVGVCANGVDSPALRSMFKNGFESFSRQRVVARDFASRHPSGDLRSRVESCTRWLEARLGCSPTS